MKPSIKSLKAPICLWTPTVRDSWTAHHSIHDFSSDLSSPHPSGHQWPSPPPRPPQPPRSYQVAASRPPPHAPHLGRLRCAFLRRINRTAHGHAPSPSLANATVGEAWARQPCFSPRRAAGHPIRRGGDRAELPHHMTTPKSCRVSRAARRCCGSSDCLVVAPATAGV
jgi:hypothetical protein